MMELNKCPHLGSGISKCGGEGSRNSCPVENGEEQVGAPGVMRWMWRRKRRVLFKSCRAWELKSKKRPVNWKMDVTGYLSEINLRRMAEVETWRRKYSQLQTSHPKGCTVKETKGKAYSNWEKKWSRAVTLAGRRGWEIYCLFSFCWENHACLSTEESLTMEGFEKSENTAGSDMVLGLSGGAQAGSTLRWVCMWVRVLMCARKLFRANAHSERGFMLNASYSLHHLIPTTATDGLSWRLMQ